MKKILVPSDFSEGAYHALKYAVGLAEKYNASIDVVNAFSMPPSGSTIMVDITDILKKSADEAMEKLRERVEAANLHEKVEIRFSTSYGNVIQMIDFWVKNRSCNMVVMGTQGASGITEKFLGTNAAAAAKQTDVPLWVIPAEKSFHMPEHILCATDMKMFEREKPLEFVADLADRFDAEVKFLHVRQSDREDADMEAHKKWVDDKFANQKTKFILVHDDDIDDGIEDTVEEENPDLLVVVRRDYGFFRNLLHSSITRQVVNSADLPILVLKD